MQKHLSDRSSETEDATFAAREPSPFLQLDETQAERKLQIIVPPLSRGQLCLDDRKARAAHHAVEFALWQASGGDFLNSAHATEFIELAQQL